MTFTPAVPKSIVALPDRYPRVVLLLILLLGAAAAVWRFGSWMPEAFFGDDLFILLAHRDGIFPSGLGGALSVAFVEKYRPVFIWLMSAMISAFDDNLRSYLAVNVLVHALNTTLVFVIARRLSHGNLIVALAVVLAAAVSRFALYQVTQVTGFLEGIALTFFLVMLYCMLRASDDDNAAAWRWCWLAILAAFLAINTHERYIVIAAWLCLALIVIPATRALSRARLCALLGACIAIGLSNAIFKVAVLKMPFFVGTGGTRMDLDIPRVFQQVWQAALSIFGFNEGPEYLIGVRAITLDWYPVWLLAVVIGLSWLITVAAGVRTAFMQNAATTAARWQALGWPLLLVALGALMLVPPVLTIRLEQRWVFAPFIIVLFLFSWAAGVLRQRAFVWVSILAVTLGLGNVISDSYIAKGFDPIFFVSSGRVAAAAKRDIADKDPGQAAPVALIASNDHCIWSLLQGGLFRVYGGVRRTTLCFNSLEDIKAAELPEGTRVFNVSYSPLGFTEVTAEVPALAPR